jgi:putative FmdB family regulatory protein
MSEPTIEVLCKNCGQTFTAFLKEMADKNAVVTCPGCGKDSRNALQNGAMPSATQN